MTDTQQEEDYAWALIRLNAVSQKQLDEVYMALNKMNIVWDQVDAW